MPNIDLSISAGGHVLALPAIDDAGRYYAGCRTCGTILRAHTFDALVPLIVEHLGGRAVVKVAEGDE